MDKINQRIATELGVGVGQVAAAVELLGEGATVPFIARYRKEKTGGLDDTQLRKLEERLGYLRELEDRRATVLKSIEEQGKLTPELSRSINGARDQGRAGRPVRALQAQAPHQGADRARGRPRAAGRRAARQPCARPRSRGRQVSSTPSKGVADAKAALDGARHILIERIGEQADPGRRACASGSGARACSPPRCMKGKAEEGAKFSDYFDFSQPIKDMPSHRALAMLRGRNEGVLDFDLDVPHEDGKPHPAEGKIKVAFNIADRGRPADAWLAETVRLAWKARLAPVAQLRPAGAPQGARRHRGDLGVRQEPEGSAAGGPGRPARHHGPRSRHPHRRQGRGRRCDRQGAGDRPPSIRTSPGATGRARSPRWPPCACATRSTSSASATARPAARPTSWSPS